MNHYGNTSPDDLPNRLRHGEHVAWLEVVRAYDRLSAVPIRGSRLHWRRRTLKQCVQRRVAAWWRALCALHPTVSRGGDGMVGRTRPPLAGKDDGAGAMRPIPLAPVARVTGPRDFMHTEAQV